MSVEVKGDDAGKAQIEVSEQQILFKSVKEDVESLQEVAKVDEGSQETPKVEGENENNEKIEKVREIEKGEGSSSSSSDSDRKVEDSTFSITEENETHSKLTEDEKKALIELRSKLEGGILLNKLSRVKVEKKEPSPEGGEMVPEKGKEKVEEEEQVHEEGAKLEKDVEVDKDITLWGVPLLPSRGDTRTDVLLIKFLKARDFNVKEAFELLKSTLIWRKENNIDSILEEDLGGDYDSMAYMKGFGREGNLVCYNVYGVFSDYEFYNKTFGTEASRERFLRWRLQLMEKQIKKLDFSPGGMSSLIQVNDLKNTPGPSWRDLRVATKQAVAILQDNYPEFVAENIFINVPLWYYAFSAIMSPFLTTRTTSKFVYSRPARVTETLLKYIAAEQIPARYGGLQREDDPNFSTHDASSEIVIKAGASETVEIPIPEAGTTLIWDLTITGWDVTYKEEFVPTDEGSYTLIVKKDRKISWQAESIRNTFKNNEPGKVVITIENGIFKKKRVLYRYKVKNASPSS